MRLNELKPSTRFRKQRKRVGRGQGSGHGKTACRGTKGQKSRSGSATRPGFEGGQMPLKRRLPKRGFTNIFRKKYALVNIKDLNIFEEGTIVDNEVLIKCGLIKGNYDGIKVLGNGEITYPITLKVHRLSKKAKDKIEAAGGKVEVV
jgi:large subunit ribosomal protein L15